MMSKRCELAKSVGLVLVLAVGLIARTRPARKKRRTKRWSRPREKDLGHGHSRRPAGRRRSISRAARSRSKRPRATLYPRRREEPGRPICPRDITQFKGGAIQGLDQLRFPDREDLDDHL